MRAGKWGQENGGRKMTGKLYSPSGGSVVLTAFAAKITSEFQDPMWSIKGSRKLKGREISNDFPIHFSASHYRATHPVTLSRVKSA